MTARDRQHLGAPSTWPEQGRDRQSNRPTAHYEGLLPRSHSVTCTDSTTDRTRSADCTGISRPPVPRPAVDRRSPTYYYAESAAPRPGVNAGIGQPSLGYELYDAHLCRLEHSLADAVTLPDTADHSVLGRFVSLVSPCFSASGLRTGLQGGLFTCDSSSSSVSGPKFSAKRTARITSDPADKPTRTTGNSSDWKRRDSISGFWEIGGTCYLQVSRYTGCARSEPKVRLTARSGSRVPCDTITRP
jgi:hypothetical protein